MLLPVKGKNCKRIRYTQPIQEASTNEELQGAATQHGWNHGLSTDTVGKHDSAHWSQPDFGWSPPSHFEVNLRPPARIIP
jgi:hypothetical protein